MNDQDPGASEGTPRTEPSTQRTRSEWLAWGLVLVSVVGACVLGIANDRSRQRVAALEANLVTMGKQRDSATQERDALRAQAQQAEREKAALGTELRETQAEREAAQRELERAKAELKAQLASEIKRGEIFVEERGSSLVIDVSDKVLFDTGQTEINDRGKEVLKQVAGTLRRMPHRVFQVGGHTDAEPIVSQEVRDQYPTNWELSTARATQVVRFLSEQCGVPGSQLVAAGFARFRPIASNATDAGKRRNRRIEIALLKEAEPKQQ
jgi:chemotaxis protein MotB